MSDSRIYNKWLVLAILAIALFMMNLDVTIVNIALPSIMNDLQTSLANVEWVINVYILVFAVSLITMGRFGDIFGRKRFFIGGLILFTAASFVCGLSGNVTMLIISRAVQAVGGAMMMPATLSILNVAFKDGQRGQAMGVWGAVSGAASALGPIIGGLIIDNLSWGYIFLVNVPIGIIAVIAGIIVIRESKEPSASRHIDWAGIISASVGLFGLTFALVEGQNYGWSSAAIIAAFVASFIGISLFVFIERRSQHPLIDMALFRKVNFSGGNTLSALLMFGLIGIIFLLVLYLQIVLGYSAIKTGLVLLPMPIMVMLIAPVAGRRAEKRGIRWILTAGMLITALSLFLLAHLSSETTWQSFIIPLLLAGTGMGLIMAPVNTVIIASAPVEKSGAASGIMTTTRQIGGLLGVAVLGAVLQSQLAANITKALNTISSIPDSLKNSIIAGIDNGSTTSSMDFGNLPAGAQAAMTQLFNDQFANSLNSAMQVAILFCIVGAIVALFIKDVKSEDTADIKK